MKKLGFLCGKDIYRWAYRSGAKSSWELLRVESRPELGVALDYISRVPEGFNEVQTAGTLFG